MRTSGTMALSTLSKYEYLTEVKNKSVNSIGRIKLLVSSRYDLAIQNPVDQINNLILLARLSKIAYTKNAPLAHIDTPKHAQIMT